MVTIGAFPLRGTTQLGTAQYGTAQLGSARFVFPLQYRFRLGGIIHMSL